MFYNYVILTNKKLPYYFNTLAFDKYLAFDTPDGNALSIKYPKC